MTAYLLTWSPKRTPSTDLPIQQVRRGKTRGGWSTGRTKTIQPDEGKIKVRLHKDRERDPRLRERKKAQALRERGELQCEVCDFVFAAIYGPLGRPFIECHHTTPMAKIRGSHKITLNELALVCANCHRMLHRSGLKPIPVLRAIVLKNRGLIGAGKHLR